MIVDWFVNIAKAFIILIILLILIYRHLYIKGKGWSEREKEREREREREREGERERERTSCLQTFIVILKPVGDRVIISEIIKAKIKGIVIWQT